MASAAPDRLGKALRGDEEPSSSTGLTVRMDALSLDVEGFGRVKFPVTSAKARKLITLGKPVRFGRGEDTVTDPEVRDTWEIPVDLVRATWDPGVLEDVLATVKEERGLPNAAELDVDLHSQRDHPPYGQRRERAAQGPGGPGTARTPLSCRHGGVTGRTGLISADADEPSVAPVRRDNMRGNVRSPVNAVVGLDVADR